MTMEIRLGFGLWLLHVFGRDAELPQKYVFIPLDIFKGILHNKSVDNKIGAWLEFGPMSRKDVILCAAAPKGNGEVFKGIAGVGNFIKREKRSIKIWKLNGNGW